MKRISGTSQAIIGIEVVLEPVEVEIPALAVPVEVRDVQVAIMVPPDRMYKISSVPLPLEYS